MTQSMVRITERYIAAHKGSVNPENIASTAAVIVVPFMNNILQRYSELDFHNAMNRTYVDEDGRVVYGFDFISDWRKNHPTAFPIMLYFAKQFRRNLNFNIEITTNMIVEILRSWRWRVTEREKAALQHGIYRIKRLIFTL